MTTWSEYASRTRSTKIALAHLFPRQRWKEWENVSGNVYKSSVPYIVHAVHLGTTALVEDTDNTPTANKFYYDSASGELFINVGGNPIPQNLILTFRLCFSSAPVNLPFDLGSGFETQYEPRLKDLGDIKLELDFENQGIALETQSSVSFFNNDGWFDDKFDVLIFENQRVIFYSWGLELAPSQRRVIFDGFMDTKSFSPTEVKFTFKDQFKRLRERMSMELFSEADGSLTDDHLNRPKRRIYGTLKNLECVGIDKVKEGYSLSGTCTIDQESNQLVGVGSAFLDELSPNDEVVGFIGDEEFSFTIASIEDDENATLSDESEVPMSGDLIVKPTRPWRKKNRRWHIAGHKLRQIETTVSEFITRTRFRITDPTDVKAGLTAIVNGELVTINRISGDLVVLDQAVATDLSGGEDFIVLPVSAVYQEDKKFEQDRDYTIDNSDDDAIIEFDELAEFNITGSRLTDLAFTFTNGSRVVSCSTDPLDLRTIFQTRDWIKANELTRPEWYEILAVSETEITLRTPFTGATFSGNALRKNVENVNDASLITCDTRGIEVDGEWKFSAARAIQHILSTDLLSANIATASFESCHEEAPQMLSYAIPKNPGADAPVIRDVIADINKSVLAAIYQDADFNFAMTLLQSDKPEDLETLEDDGIISFQVNTKQTIANLVQLNYRPFKDPFSKKDTFKLVEFVNDFVNETSQIQNTAVATAFLYDEEEAETLSQRLGFIKSVTNTVVTIKGKIDLIRFGIGSKVGMAFDRMFTRYGNEANQRVGIVHGVQSDESSVTLMLNDYNGVFTRVPAIAPDDAADYDDATDAEKAKWGYICDDDTETPDADSNASLGNNLIG